MVLIVCSILLLSSIFVPRATGPILFKTVNTRIALARDSSVLDIAGECLYIFFLDFGFTFNMQSVSSIKFLKQVETTVPPTCIP